MVTWWKAQYLRERLELEWTANRGEEGRQQQKRCQQQFYCNGLRGSNKTASYSASFPWAAREQRNCCRHKESRRGMTNNLMHQCKV